MKPTLNNVKLRHKLMLLYLLCVFVPILFTNLFFYAVTTHNVRNQREKDIALSLEQIQNEFKARIDDAIGISSVFYADGLINEALETVYASPVQYLDAYDEAIRSNLGKYGSIYRFVRDISIYTDNPTVLGSGGIRYIDEAAAGSDWYRQALSTRSGVPVLARSGAEEAAGFSIVRVLNGFSARNIYLKVLRIDLHRDTIGQALSNPAFPGAVYLVDPAGNVAYTTDRQWREQGAAATGFQHIAEREDHFVYLAEFPRSDYLRGWSIAGVLPVEQMLEEVGKSRRTVVYLACANLLLPTLVIVWITKSLHDRLLHMVRHVKKVKRQSYEPLPEALETKDELGQLAVELNRMTNQIKRLFGEVFTAELGRKDAELQRKRAQIHALQSQINPHFLFNTLETLRMRSLIKGETETAGIVRNMAKLFRKSLAWGNDWVTVQQELDLIRSFLEIQKYRFGDRLHYRIDIGVEAEQRRIPKMVFLPFVENASIHGIEKIEGRGLIELAVASGPDGLLFSLRDNGGGMDALTLQRAATGRLGGEGDESHVGIRNVRNRLALYYGDRARLDMESAPGSGTSVRIYIPHHI